MYGNSAKCGHVKRRLTRGEPLTGKVLQFALEVLAESGGGTGDDFTDGIAEKLLTRTQLTDYELHLMVDVFLLHQRLGGNASIERTD